MADYSRQEDTKLCDDCRLKIARATMKDGDVIMVLSGAGREFSTYLNENIITQNMRQTINRAQNDGEALGYIRDAFSSSLDPHMVDELLKVLEQIGKKLHAEKIKTVYDQKIVRHKQCERCKEGFPNTAPVQETGPTVSNAQSTVSSSPGRGGFSVTPMKPSLIEDLQRDKGVYKVGRQVRGTALIINMRNVVGSHERLGSEHDVTNLENLFRQLHFEPKVHEDLNKMKMEETLKNEWQEQGKMDPDAFILCIMSHGCRISNRDYICCSDGLKFDVDRDICGPLGRCKGLRRKPKILIIQACRSDPSSAEADSVPVGTPADKADMLIAFSTVSDWNSYRTQQEGSYFIQSIVRTFSEEAHRSHIVDMLTKVREEVDNKHGHQVSEDVQRLKKKFYFFPGYI